MYVTLSSGHPEDNLIKLDNDIIVLERSFEGAHILLAMSFTDEAKDHSIDERYHKLIDSTDKKWGGKGERNMIFNGEINIDPLSFVAGKFEH